MINLEMWGKIKGDNRQCGIARPGQSSSIEPDPIGSIGSTPLVPDPIGSIGSLVA